MYIRLIKLLLITFTISVFIPLTVLADSQFILDQSYYLQDNQKISMDAKTSMINGRVLLPVRYLAESMNIIDVGWDGTAQKVTLTHNNNTMVLYVGNNNYTFNGETKYSDVPPQVFSDGRVYLPARIVAESFGYNVAWNDFTKTVTLSKKELTPKEIYKLVTPAVLKLEVYDANKNLIGSGSGFIVDPDGIAITNYHVIENASYIRARYHYSSTSVQYILKIDEEKDIAIIKLEGNNFPVLSLGDSKNISNGDSVYAIGSPLGLDGSSISDGIISQTNRWLNNQHFIQMTTPISPGNSGGVLVNTYGEAIGITTASFEDGQNLNLAIPINETIKFLWEVNPTKYAYRYFKEHYNSVEYKGKLYFATTEYKDGISSGLINVIDKNSNIKAIAIFIDQYPYQFSIYEDYIYVIVRDSERSLLYCININGMELSLVSDNPVHYIIEISNGWIYYAQSAGDSVVYKMRLDGSEKQVAYTT